MCVPKYILREHKQAQRCIVHAGQLIDGVADQPLERVSISVEEGRVTAITPGFVRLDGAHVVDLSSATVLPGLIDCHVHLAYDMSASSSLALQLATKSAFDELLVAAASARKSLWAGFTSVRDVGGTTPVVVALRKSIAAGATLGSRMWVSGSIICPTAGHADYRNAFDAALSKPEWLIGIADGADAMLKAVREQKRAGVDFIKIAPSGGVTSHGSNPHAQSMNAAEIKAVVDAAHALDLKVAAHAHGRVAINACLEHGVDSIEHGTFADERSYELMVRSEAWLVPTLLVGGVEAEMVKQYPQLLTPEAAKKALGMGPLMSANLTSAHRAGVKIAFGTDAGICPHGKNAREFALLVGAGMSPMQAIKTATSNAADLIGASDIGRVQPGGLADLIATQKDPLADVTELERVAFVMQGGEIIRSELHA